MVAWGSFTAQNVQRGFLQFYATGNIGIIYDKAFLPARFGSAYSDKVSCEQSTSMSYNANGGILTIEAEICADGEECMTNPCPYIMAPEAMGHTPGTTTLTMTLDMQAVITAISINTGINKLNHLVQVAGDNDRTYLLDQMVAQNKITAYQANHTSSYFDNRFAPVKTIYW